MCFRYERILVLFVVVLLAGCAGTGRRPLGTLYETPMPQSLARFTVKDEKCLFRIDRLQHRPRTVVQVNALPDVQSQLARAMVPSASPEIDRVLSATEAWSSFLFERTALSDGDVIKFKADRRGIDFVFDYHVPFNMPSVGIEVQCYLEEGTEISVATQAITIPGVSRRVDYWPVCDADTGPVEIPIYEPIIALVTDTNRLIGISVQPEMDRGVIDRTVQIKRQKKDLTILLASTLRHPPGKSARQASEANISTMYRLILSWADRDTVSPDESETTEASHEMTSTERTSDDVSVEESPNEPEEKKSTPPAPRVPQPFLLPLPAATSEW